MCIRQVNISPYSLWWLDSSRLAWVVFVMASAGFTCMAAFGWQVDGAVLCWNSGSFPTYSLSSLKRLDWPLHFMPTSFQENKPWYSAAYPAFSSNLVLSHRPEPEQVTQPTQKCEHVRQGSVGSLVSQSATTSMLNYLPSPTRISQSGFVQSLLVELLGIISRIHLWCSSVGLYMYGFAISAPG